MSQKPINSSYPRTKYVIGLAMILCMVKLSVSAQQQPFYSQFEFNKYCLTRLWRELNKSPPFT